ncbi:MAG: NifB/NifX family molybdenum-iron cluster-binding protein [Anaerolineales bacterium]|nr:NifB/NifX family molybdenum-iron cluster-binding protein [Anaerolineales bacterium]
MKIAISAISSDLDAAIDPRFGRAAYFVIVDTDILEWQAYPNPGANASGGAGTQAAQYIASLGVCVAVSGDFGPNAYSALNAADIHMYLLGTSQTVRETVENYRSGQLVPIDTPTANGHYR